MNLIGRPIGSFSKVFVANAREEEPKYLVAFVFRFFLGRVGVGGSSGLPVGAALAVSGALRGARVRIAGGGRHVGQVRQHVQQVLTLQFGQTGRREGRRVVVGAGAGVGAAASSAAAASAAAASSAAASCRTTFR